MNFKLAISTGQKIGLIGLLIFIAFLAFYNLKGDRENVVYKRSLPNDYLNLIKDSALREVKFIRSSTSRFKSPVAEFSYKGFYTIQLFKVGRFKERNISQIIKVDTVSKVQQSTGKYSEMYGDMFKPGLYINYQTDTVKIMNLTLHLSGDSIMRFKSDNNILAYSLKLNSFSLNFNSGTETHIWGGLSRNGPKQMNSPLGVAFIYTKTYLYFVTIIPERQSAYSPQSLFVSIFK